MKAKGFITLAAAMSTQVLAQESGKLFGFELSGGASFAATQFKGADAAFITAGGYHHIGLNTWFSKNPPKAVPRSVGLFHAAVLYPTRKDLAAAYKHLLQAGYPLSGASDHGVSEALYLDDPDGNGVELYWDRPPEAWPRTAEGDLDMYTRPLDPGSLLGELSNDS